jgi:hypothetical protein
MTNNYSTERIEQALNGIDVQLSTEDLSIIVVGLIVQNKELKQRVKALEDYLYVDAHIDEEKYTSTVVDGSRIWHPKGETL